MALFVRWFGKFIKKKGYGARRRRSSSKRKEERRCYKCGSIDHLIADCPHNDDNDKSNKDKKKDDKEGKKITFKKKKGHAYCVSRIPMDQVIVKKRSNKSHLQTSPCSIIMLHGQGPKCTI